MKHIALFSAFLLVFGIVGCNRQQRPPGLPELFPCSVKIIQEEGPLEGAKILFHQQNATGTTWIVGGLTDAKGIATMKTNGSFDGCPVGDYKVVVMKVETHIPEGNLGKPEDLKVTEFVEKQYSNLGTTPLKLTFDGKQQNHEFHVGAKVSIDRVIKNPAAKH